jgi:preprotein translocase subunit SecF
MGALAAIGTRVLGMVGLGGVSPIMLLAAALALVGTVSGLVFAIDQRGHARAEAKCDAAAQRARVAELQTQLKNANDRAERAARVIVDLQAVDAQNAEQIETLRRDVAAAQLQSTQPGAKPNANAILDDRCLYTDHGARRVRGQ